MKTWSELGFEIELTADGSITLRQLQSVESGKGHGESMHHSGGAWAETLLIYGVPIRKVLQKIPQPHFLIVGLGLGYIELTIAREAILLGKTAQNMGSLFSYESMPELRSFFFSWLWEQSEELLPEVFDTYNKVAMEVAGQDVSIKELKLFLRAHFRTERDIQGPLTPGMTFPFKYHCILYDAFSAKTTPFLWEEEFLRHFLQSAAASSCQFSTYASRVSLKQALAAEGFEIFTRPGFKSKRNSTLGIK